VINLKIEKHGPESSSQGSPGEYEIVMTNEIKGGGSGQTASSVKMVDPLPVGLIPLSTTAGDGNNWQCSIAENPINVVECVGDLEPTKPVTIKIAVFMTADSQPFDNEACFVPNPDVRPAFRRWWRSSRIRARATTAPRQQRWALPRRRSRIWWSPRPPAVAGRAWRDGDLHDPRQQQRHREGDVAADADGQPADRQRHFVSALGTNGWTCSGTGPVVCHDGGGLGLEVGASTTITIQATVKATTTLPFVNGRSPRPPPTTGGSCGPRRVARPGE
jgi:hypothetical protein